MTTVPRGAPFTPARELAWRAWALPAVLALAVALCLLASPLATATTTTAIDFGSGEEVAPFGWAALAGLSWWDSNLLPLWGMAGGVSVVIGVLLARRYPTLATTLALWPFLSVWLWATFAWAWWAALLVITCLAVQGPWRKAIYPFAATLATAWVYALTGIPAATPVGQVNAGAYGEIWQWRAAAIYTVATVLVVACAVAFRAATRASRLERDAAVASRRAFEIESVTSERARLARDLHDVVAHHVSLVAVRAEAAPFQHPDLPETARAVLRDIATDARSALDELRQVLTILRRAGDADLGPQPGACDIVDLVEQARAAGHDVTLVGACDGVPAAQGYVLFRAAQEGLTNARRHAPGSATLVTLYQKAAVVGVRVENAVDPLATPGEPLPGRGLLGMRERVEALGGAVTTESDGGTFRLVVALPLPVGVGASVGENRARRP